MPFSERAGGSCSKSGAVEEDEVVGGGGGEMCWLAEFEG